jgi:hypothetical protein
MSDVGKDFVHWVQQWRFSLAFVTSSLKLTNLNKYTIKFVYTGTKYFVVSAHFSKNISIKEYIDNI